MEIFNAVLGLFNALMLLYLVIRLKKDTQK